MDATDKNKDINIKNKDIDIKRRPLWLRIFKWTGISIGSIILLFVVALCGITLWLTPERLASIVNKEASKALNADVHAGDVSFTFWSTFPRLFIDIDSVDIRSRNFDSIPPELREKLPCGADLLLSTGKIHGGINITKLLKNQFWLRDITVDSLRVNLVALSDSLNNFDISHSKGEGKVPYFNISNLGVSGKSSIRYTSVPTSTEATVVLDDATLKPSGRGDNYALSLPGRITAQSGNLTILRDFPFCLSGDVHFKFDPFGISTNDYRIALGNVIGNLDLDMDLGGNPGINLLSYDIKNFSLGKLIELLPDAEIPALKGLSANLTLSCSARLTSPYKFSSPDLPSAEVNIDVPRGDAQYSLSDNEQLRVDDISMRGRLLFDGKNPEKSYVDIPSLKIRGLGTEVDANAHVTQLTTAPSITANMSTKTDLKTAAKSLKWIRAFSPAGILKISANASFTVEGNNITGTIMDIKALAPQISMTYDSCFIKIKDLKASTSENYAGALTGKTITDNIPVNVNLSAGGLQVKAPAQKLTLNVKNIAAAASADTPQKGKLVRKINLKVNGGSSTALLGYDKIMANNLALRVSGGKLKKATNTPRFSTPVKWVADSADLRVIPHTPQLLSVSLPDAAKDFVRNWDMRLDMTLGNASLTTDRYRADNRVKDLDLTATFDSVMIHRAEVSSGDTRGLIAVKAGNLRSFLTSGGYSPLRLDVKADFDTLQLNNLARVYALSNPESALATGDTERLTAHLKNVAYILPRNLLADIHATAKHVRYINLHFFDLYTDIDTADGIADIDTLHLASDFCEADARIKYDTSDLEHMQATAMLDVDNINVVKLLQNFESIQQKFPSIKNLSGMVGVEAKTHMLIFPNMYLNVPSLWADANVKAWDLKVKQNKFIHHIAEMMMLRGHDDLLIADMDIHAGLHSNILEVFPFTFEMSKYKVQLEGLNNLNGDLYYHIGVEDWPLHFPFGINIKGTYDHPQLRFGGHHWHDKNSARVAVDIENHDEVNLLHETVKYGGKLFYTAANYRE